MKNKDVLEYINSCDNKTYLADSFTSEGYGQTVGGYRKSNNEITSQKEHFIHFYRNKGDKLPTYEYLRCPELILFICEIVDVPKHILEDSVKILKEYEDEQGIHYKEKNGNYIWGKEINREYRRKLKFSNVVKLIKTTDNFCVLKQKVNEIF